MKERVGGMQTMLRKDAAAEKTIADGGSGSGSGGVGVASGSDSSVMQRYDRDHDGTLDRDEVREYVTQVGGEGPYGHINEGELDQLMEAVDRNHDGAISADELLALEDYQEEEEREPAATLEDYQEEEEEQPAAEKEAEDVEPELSQLEPAAEKEGGVDKELLQSEHEPEPEPEPRSDSPLVVLAEEPAVLLADDGSLLAEPVSMLSPEPEPEPEPEPGPSPAVTPRKYDDWQPEKATPIKGDDAVTDAADRLKKRLDALKAKSAAQQRTTGQIEQPPRAAGPEEGAAREKPEFGESEQAQMMSSEMLARQSSVRTEYDDSVYAAGGAYDGVKGEPSFASMSSSEDASSIRDEVPQNDIGDLVLEDADVSDKDAGDIAPPGGAREEELATRTRPG
jgi:Ca2+-binding EF-hand superfamily protein